MYPHVCMCAVFPEALRGATGCVALDLLDELPVAPSIPGDLDLLAALGAEAPTPAAASASTGADAEPLREATIEKLAEHAFLCLPLSSRAAIKAWIDNIGPQGLKVASVFSGSDFGRTAVTALLRVCRPPNFPLPAISHVMAVENVPWKRDWLMHIFPPMVMYADASEVCKEEEPIDCMTGKPTPVPEAHIAFLGFACKSLSSMNPHRADFGDAIKNKRGSSGETADLAVEFLKKFHPPIALLENVPGLLTGYRRSLDGEEFVCEGSNMEVLLRKLREIGYSMVKLYWKGVAMGYGGLGVTEWCFG